jgi:hypothetical protein
MLRISLKIPHVRNTHFHVRWLNEYYNNLLCKVVRPGKPAPVALAHEGSTGFVAGPPVQSDTNEDELRFLQCALSNPVVPRGEVSSFSMVTELWQVFLEYSSFACDVIAAMLEDDNKRFVIIFFCLWYQHGRHVFVFGFSWEWLQTNN